MTIVSVFAKQNPLDLMISENQSHNKVSIQEKAEMKGWWQSLSLQPHGLEILLLHGTPPRLYLRTSKDLPNSSIS